MGTETVRAIDVHAHCGTYESLHPLIEQLTSGDAARVLHLADLARTEICVVSTLRACLEGGGPYVAGGNEEIQAAVEAHPRLRQWALLDPRAPESFEQTARLLAQPRCVGIKIHPEGHEYPIAEYGQAIFAFAAEHGTIVETHSGGLGCLPLDFVPFLDDFPEVKLILAHLGAGGNGDMTHQVRAIQRSRHGNVYTDTSSAMSITTGLLEWAVGEVGADKILFGTDSPLYYAPMQRARVDTAEITDQEKTQILHENAERLLGITLPI